MPRNNDWEIVNLGNIFNIPYDYSATPSPPVSDRYNVAEDKRLMGLSLLNVSRALEREFSFKSQESEIKSVGKAYFGFNAGTYAVGVAYFFVARRQCGGDWFDVNT